MRASHNRLFSPSPKVALILTGGGARAAYQVGILKALSEYYPHNHGCPFVILCGTSAGAINASALAVYASCFRLGVKKLDYIWRNFRCGQVFYSQLGQVGLHILKQLSRPLRADYHHHRSPALLNNLPLRELLNRVLNYPRIDQNIAKGYLHALAVTASNYIDGNSISFYQAQGHQQDWQRARRYGKKTQINTSHLLASSAIPLIFPAEAIGQDYFGDGSVHQLSPLSPAIHLGAEKIISIHLEQKGSPRTLKSRSLSAGAIAGHVLDSAFTDTLNSDIERLARINQSLSFIEPVQQQALGLRHIEQMSIYPSINFDTLAHQHFDCLPKSARGILAMLGVRREQPSPLASFIMFERDFTRALIDEGYRDGQRLLDEIIEFIVA